MHLTETTLKTERLLDGIVFDVDRHDVRLGDGSESKRDIVRHSGGVGVLAQRPDGSFVLVRQYRKAVEREVVEIVAGLREPDEDPEETARRELAEETGEQAGEMIFLGTFLASPGYTDEVDHLFYTRTTGQTEQGKLDADERLVVEIWEHQALFQAVVDNTLKDGKTIVAWSLAREKGLV
jgi:ADP-ribose pyrophosphatase